MEADEYEKERQENIRKNRELLLSLGLNPGQQQQKQRSTTAIVKKRKASTSSTQDETPPPTSSRPRRTIRAPASRQLAPPKKVTPTVPAATRKSSRLSGQDSISYNEDDDESANANARRRRSHLPFDRSPSPLYAAPRLKRLRNPSPPNLEDGEANGTMTQELDRAMLPRRAGNGNIIFENNNRHFMPNVTPQEMLQGGIFGGTPFRPFYSRVLRQNLDPQAEMAEFPAEWYQGLDPATQLTSEEHDPEANRYGVKAGQSLEDWENAGWIRTQDPRGWWQWYFRFYLGRRTTDDARQIGRWLKACGPAGRFKRSLVAKIHRAGATWDDESITPVVRQTLFHWAYRLTEEDYHAYL